MGAVVLLGRRASGMFADLPGVEANIPQEKFRVHEEVRILVKISVRILDFVFKGGVTIYVFFEILFEI